MAAHQSLVEEHRDEDWMGGFARAMLYRQPEHVRSLLERSSNPVVQGQTLLTLAEDAYNGSIQDDREPEYVAARVAEGERLFCELLTRFPEGLPQQLPYALSPDVDAWRMALFELEHLHVGHRAPALDALYANGEDVRLADYRGRVVVICLSRASSGAEQQLEFLSELVERRAGMPLSVLATREPWDRKERTLNPGLIWVDVKRPGQRAQPSIWDVGILPWTLILDGRGVIRHRALRYLSLEQAVDALLVEAVLPAHVLSLP